MYTVHHDAKLLPAELVCADYEFNNAKVPGLNVSASRAKDGKIHVSLCNLNVNASAELTCELQGATGKRISGRVLTARAMNTHNTFPQPDAIQPIAFYGAKLTESGFMVTLPPKSVVVLAIE